MENRLSNTYYLKKICVCGDVVIRVDRKESNIIYVLIFYGHADFCMYFQNIS